MRDDHTILALVPGRHRLGYAVFYKNKLILYGIASLSTFKTEAEIFTILEKFLSRILSRFSVGYIAVKELHPSQIQSALLVEIARFLQTFGKRRKIKTLSFDGKSVNQKFCETGARPTKDRTAAALISKYPELKRYYDLKRPWQKRYYAPVFQAIVLGLVLMAKLNEKLNDLKK